MTDMTIPQDDQANRSSPIGLVRYAFEFFDAARAVDNDVGMRPGHEIVAPVTVLYLTGHSIELVLKAFLLHAGVPLSELKGKKFGHDLHRCMRKAKELGLSAHVALRPDEFEVIEILNDLYARKELEYFMRGFKTYPSYGPLETAAARLLNGIGSLVGYARHVEGYLDV